MEEWSHAVRLFNKGLLEQSRQVIHRLRTEVKVFGNHFYQHCCARCSLIFLAGKTCSVKLKRWGAFRKVLCERRKAKGLFDARFRKTILISTFVNMSEGVKRRRLDKADYVVVYHCLNCDHDIVFDVYPASKADLEPVLERKSRERVTQEPKQAQKKLVVKQILGNRPPPKSDDNALDLFSFLKKL